MSIRPSIARVLSLVCTLVLCVPTFGFAQAPTSAQDSTSTAPPELSSCFDFYRFGSTPVAISGSLSEVSPGASLGITGSIVNRNPYPLQGVKVVAKLFKIRADGEKDVYGPDVLTATVVADNLALKSQETKPLTFEIQVPQHAEKGRYRIATFVTSMDRFSLLGLTFTDDIIGGIFDFDVAEGGMGAIGFNKQSVTVNGSNYLFAAFPPRISTTTKDVTVTAEIVNNATGAAKGTLSWKLYSWSGERQEQLIDEKSEPFKTVSKQKKTVSYTISDTQHAVYYLVGELSTDRGDTSIIGIRFVREGVAEPRIAFVGVMPRDIEGPSQAFTCVHSSGLSGTDNATLTLEIQKDGKSLGDKYVGTYQGMIPGEMSALSFWLETLPSTFEVVATLSHKGTVLDTVSTSYVCEEVSTNCSDSIWSQIVPTPPEIGAWYLIGGILLLLGAVFFVYKRKRSSVTPFTPPSTTPNPPLS